MDTSTNPATPRRRLLAFGVDYTVIAAYLIVLLVVGLTLTFGPSGEAWATALATPWRMHLLAFVTTVLPVTLYFAFTESGRHAASLGKRRLGLEVVSVDGTPPSLPQALLRNALKFMPWQLAHTAMLSIPGFPTQVEQIPAWALATLIATWLLVAAYLLGLSRWLGGRPLYDRIAVLRVQSRSVAD